MNIYDVVNAVIEQDKKNRLDYEISQFRKKRRNAAVLADGKQVAIYHQYHKLSIKRQAKRKYEIDKYNRSWKNIAKRLVYLKSICLFVCLFVCLFSYS